ncbi:MAG: hypothetical protein HY907_14130 [Deltaproteobacteria bacterium]|nr:hypothetical protein [Deltaproteobacteria bacterium]
MRSTWTRFAWPAAAVLGFAAGGTALGCGAAGLGLGSLGLGVAALAGYLLFAAGASSGCSSRGPVGACLSIAPARDAGTGVEAAEPPPQPCLSPALPPPGPCLQPPYVGPCLEYDDQSGGSGTGDSAEPCLRVAPHPCLSRPAPPEDAGAGPDAGVEPCLEAPDHVCLSIAPPGRSSAAPARGDRDSAERLAAAGVLTAEQLRRLARLRGEVG